MTEQSTNPQVHSLKDLTGDLARTHRATGGDRGVEPAQTWPHWNVTATSS